MASEVIGRSTAPTAGSLLSNIILASASVSNVSNQRHQTSPAYAAVSLRPSGNSRSSKAAMVCNEAVISGGSVIGNEASA